MTKEQCEEMVLDRLAEIREIMNEYDPGIDGCCTVVTNDLVSMFVLAEDEKGQPITGKHLLYRTRFFDEGGKSHERMAV